MVNGDQAAELKVRVLLQSASAKIVLAQEDTIPMQSVFVRWAEPPSPETSEVVHGSLESGSVLIRVGNVNVHGKSLDEIVRVIRCTNRPLSLYFSK